MGRITNNVFLVIALFLYFCCYHVKQTGAVNVSPTITTRQDRRVLSAITYLIKLAARLKFLDKTKSIFKQLKNWFKQLDPHAKSLTEEVIKFTLENGTVKNFTWYEAIEYLNSICECPKSCSECVVDEEAKNNCTAKFCSDYDNNPLRCLGCSPIDSSTYDTARANAYAPAPAPTPVAGHTPSSAFPLSDFYTLLIISSTIIIFTNFVILDLNVMNR